MTKRVAFGSKPRQRLVVEAGEPVIEERGAAIGKDGGDDLIVWNLTLEERLAPDGRVERQRNRFAWRHRRSEERRSQVLALPRVSFDQPRREERPHDIEHEVAAIDRQHVEGARDTLGRNRQSNGHAHSRLPGADCPIGQQEDDDHERARTHKSVARREAV